MHYDSFKLERKDHSQRIPFIWIVTFSGVKITRTILLISDLIIISSEKIIHSSVILLMKRYIIIILLFYEVYEVF